MWTEKLSTGDVICMGFGTASALAYLGADWRPSVAIACYAFALSLARLITN